MEKIDEQLNNITSVEIPLGMHQFVMRRINYKKLLPVLLVAFILLAFNFIVIVWHINAKLIDVEFTDMIQDFFEVFNFNFSFFSTIWTSFFEIISPALVLSAIMSLVGVIYTGKKINSYRLAGI
jgi:hypothetical protein